MSAVHAESGDSNHSLLSREGSAEIGSQYMIENGVYMSTFAATIFVAALVTIGILMLTLLIALTVMLDACQSRDNGFLDKSKSSEHFEYCKIYVSHAELNNLEADEFPAICRQYAKYYTEEGRFLRELDITTQLVENFFNDRKPDEDRLDVILIDADDIVLSAVTNNSISSRLRKKHVEELKYHASITVLKLCTKLEASGWSLVFFTRKFGSNRNNTMESLVSLGFDSRTSLITRTEDELQMESWEYLSNRRLQLQSQGFRITSVISSNMDAFRGPGLGKQNFKLVNLIHYIYL